MKQNGESLKKLKRKFETMKGYESDERVMFEFILRYFAESEIWDKVNEPLSLRLNEDEYSICCENTTHMMNALKEARMESRDMLLSIHHSTDRVVFSGFGWDESNKLLTASNDVWNDYINVKANKDKGKWRNKSFPHFEDLCVAFGKNCSHGNRAKDVGDCGRETTIEVKESDEELEPMMEGCHNVPRTTTAQVDENKNIEVDEVKQVRCKKRKRQMNPLVDG
ncbi:hypothetical protein Tco_0790998 [Tanacetum coccineum]